MRISSGKGEVIAPGTFKCVDGAGMPIPGTGGMRFGDLYVKFSITFPSSGTLTTSALAALRATLPPGPREKIPASSLPPSSKPGEIIEEVYGSKAASSSSSSSTSSGTSKGAGAKVTSPKNNSSSKKMDVDGINISEDADGDSPAADFIPKSREGEIEEVVMSDVSAESRAERVKSQSTASHGEAYNEDEDEEGGGGRRVQCAQQ